MKKTPDSGLISLCDSSKSLLFPHATWYCKPSEKRTSKRGMIPCRRWGHSVILYENQMYLFGGSGHNNTNPRNWETIYVLDCESLEWEKSYPYDINGTNNPEPRDSHAAVLIGKKMYVFGGSNGDIPLNDLYTFNLETKSWNSVECKGQIPNPREGHSGVALYDRFFFIFGGWDGKVIFHDSYLFDSETKIWYKIDVGNGIQPNSRESHTCILLQDYIYIFGGQGNTNKKKETYYNDLFRLKISFENEVKTGVWEKLKPKNNRLPSPRTSHSIIGYKNRYLIVVGGEGYASESEGPNEEVFIKKQKLNFYLNFRISIMKMK